MSDAPAKSHEASIVETLQSLIIAFVLAMAFRGFVLEGFVIPTGSMAPTLLGQHILWTSEASGYAFAMDGTPGTLRNGSGQLIVDPILGDSIAGLEGGRNVAVGQPAAGDLRAVTRSGDRILVLKWLYSFFDPQRYDIVVFKNPTDHSQNYIKRLVGLPGEEIWLADGDVFVRLNDGDPFKIRPKPDYVQRAVWQPVHDSRYRPPPDQYPDYTEPWQPNTSEWDMNVRGSYRYTGDEPTSLMWNGHRRQITDWNAYNTTRFSLPPRIPHFPVSDLRLRAAIEPERSGLTTTFEIAARNHVFQFRLEGAEALARMRPRYGPVNDWPQWERGTITPMTPGRTTNVEFWHVDQMMRIFVDGDEVVTLTYDWSARERMLHAMGRAVEEVVQPGARENIFVNGVRPSDPALSWEFDGSPFILHDVRLDRDLYYRPDNLRPSHQSHAPKQRGPALATHPEHTARLGPDHFLMCGDNSASSLDGRLWGSPHPLIAELIDDSPFVVNRRLLIGKAFFVYFPSPYGLKERGARFIPDFGRLRFIR